MNLTLTRLEFNDWGIVSGLTDENGNQIAVTLEHAYLNLNQYIPKIPNGIYICKRGQHQLLGGQPFETFEVMNVQNCTGILFHVGNYNKDSSGCVLLGEELLEGEKMITNSTVTFRQFMNIQNDVDAFQLTVV